MISVGTMNYKELYFEQKSLRIAGKPNFDSLHELLLQLKANSNSVPYSLGGGVHGYIKMIIYVMKYVSLAPMKPFIIPTHPGIPTVAGGAKQYEITWIKMIHEEAVQNVQAY